MTWFDWAAIFLLLVSIGWGIWRGLVREVMSLAGWVIAFLAANLLAAPVADLMPDMIKSPEARTLVAFAVVFLGVLVVTTLATIVLARLVHSSGLQGLDRTLGALFGFLRGVLILVVVGLVAGLTPMPKQAFWKESTTAGMLERTALQLKPWLPKAYAERLRYH